MFFIPIPPASRLPFPISVELGRGDFTQKRGSSSVLRCWNPFFANNSERVVSLHSPATPAQAKHFRWKQSAGVKFYRKSICFLNWRCLTPKGVCRDFQLIGSIKILKNNSLSKKRLLGFPQRGRMSNIPFYGD